MVYENEEDACVPYKFDAEVVLSARPIVKTVCIASLCLSVVLDIFAFKWRSVANAILYIEVINGVTIFMIPSTATRLSDYYVATGGILTFMASYTN